MTISLTQHTPANELPPVSVVTPAYNHGAVLRETVESVLRQDYPRIEYLVLDDGSTDSTPDVLRQYADQIRVIRQANLGEIRTLNRALQLAAGDYVMVLNDDDTIEPVAVRVAVNFLRQHPDVLACYPDFTLIDERSRRVSDVIRREFDYRDAIRRWACLPGPGVVLTRRALQCEPERDPRYEHVGDLEYWFRLGLHGRIARVPQMLASHRVHARSKQVSDYEQVARQMLELVDEFFQRKLPAEVRRLEPQARASAHYEAACRFRLFSRRFVRHLAGSLYAAPGHSLYRLGIDALHKLGISAPAARAAFGPSREASRAA